MNTRDPFDESDYASSAEAEADDGFGGQFDWSDFEAQTRTVMKPGRYNAIVTAASLEYSREKHDPMLLVSFKVTEGEYEGVPLSRNLMFIPKAMGFTKRRVRTLLGEEPTGRYASAADAARAIAQELPGHVARLLVGPREYNNQTYNDVKDILDVDPGAVAGGAHQRPRREGLF